MNPSDAPGPRIGWFGRLAILPPLLVGVAAIVLAPQLRSAPQVVAAQERATKVRVIRVTEMPVAPRAIGYGTAAPARTWEAVAQVAGPVAYVADALEGGRSVEAGTELLRIDDSDYRLALAQLQAQLRASETRDKATRASLGIAQKNLELLEADLERKRGLAARGTLPRTAVEDGERQVLGGQTQVVNLRNALEINAAERRVLEAQRERAELELARTRIRAPFDVRITEPRIGLAQYANRGQLLFRADGLDTVEVDARFPIGVLRPLLEPSRAPTGVEGLQALVRLRTIGGDIEWPARIERVSGVIDAATQSVGVVVAIERPTEQARPGERPPLLRNTFVEVELRAPPGAPRLVVPLAAVRQGKVSVVDSDDRLALREVELAFSRGGYAVIAAGLQPDERVIVSDLVSPVPGMLLAAEDDPKAKRRLVAEATGQEPVR